MKKISALLLSLIASSIFGCAKSKVPDANVKADPNIHHSFSVVKVNGDQNLNGSGGSPLPAQDSHLAKIGDLKPNGIHIRIQKAALEKEFLWNVNLIQQLVAPRFKALKGRIVAFRLRGKDLFMLEATQGHSVTNELPQTLILARFPIVSEDKISIEFDFNNGIKDQLSASDMRASDIDGKMYDEEKEFESIPIKFSYINEARLIEQKSLLISQIAVVSKKNAEGVEQNSPVELKHYFSPYQPNLNYQPISSVNFDRMGFFEVAPLLNLGSSTDVYATRFDPAKDKTITYAISANTPAEYRDAVRTGILYWNEVFGYEKIKVVDAPVGRSAPDPEYNIVQWINWDSAGSAYADLQTDPRTGEIQHAQVFMTSAFAFASKARIRAHLRKLKTDATNENFVSSFTVSSTPHSEVCDRHENGSLESLLTSVVGMDLDDERILQISQDYVRETVAHEIGHTLGLRHNFAGTLGSNLNVFESEGIYKEYLKHNAIADGLILSTSVMDYQFFSSAVMQGQMILQKKPVGEYDKRAIGVLYNNEKLDYKNLPLFCTDSQNGSVVGCAVWDRGPSPLANAKYTEDQLVDGLPLVLLEKMIRSKSSVFGESSKEIDEIVLTPKKDAQGLISNRETVVKLLAEDAKYLRTMRSFSKIDDTNIRSVREKTSEAVNEEIERLGGLPSLLVLPSDSLMVTWLDKFNKLIESETYKSGFGYDGQPYSFSAQEIAQAKLVAKSYFEAVQESLAEEDVEFFAKKTFKLFDSPMADQYADVLAERMLEYLMAESGESIVDEVSFSEKETAVLGLPVFKYPHNIRLMAVSGLLGAMPKMPGWGLNQYLYVRSIYLNKIVSILRGKNILEIRTLKNPKLISQWLLENSALVKVLIMRESTF